MKYSEHLVWIDLEMTGLDPDQDTILEIATIVTDSQLNIVAEGPNLAIYQEEDLLDAMDDWNTKHHTQSGLVDRVLDSSIDMSDAEDQTLQFIMEFVAVKSAPLCGNSIHQDRRFLRKYMPRLHDYLHYRNIDVSSIKELVKRWYPEDRQPPRKRNTHQALDDIRESIEELIYYREHIFVQD